VGDEIAVFEAAYRNRLPVLLKGPTGCGKTRFMEHMAWRLRRPLITVSCHDDLTASDLVGRFLVRGGETVWVDGPLTRAVRAGGICYLDEIVEARKDTTVVIHPLADDRRVLPIEKLGELIEAADDFCLTISYNPATRACSRTSSSPPASASSRRLRLPRPELERRIVVKEAGVGEEMASRLVKLAQMTRNLKGSGLEEGALDAPCWSTPASSSPAASTRWSPARAPSRRRSRTTARCWPRSRSCPRACSDA